MATIIKQRTKEKKEPFRYPQKEGDKNWPKTKKEMKEMVEEHNKQHIHDNYHANARRNAKVDSKYFERFEKLKMKLSNDKEYQIILKEQSDNEEALRNAEKGRNYPLAGQFWRNRWEIINKLNERYKRLESKL
jgi:hypothetical protein